MSGPNRQENRQRPWGPGLEAESVSFGTWLRRQRELREISLREIADVTKISIRYLEALEQDRFDVLPAPVFAKGFLREYATYVGLDADEVVNSYIKAQQDLEPEPEPEPWGARKSASLEWTSGLLLALLVVLLLVVVGVLAFYAERWRGDRRPEPPPMAVPAVERVPIPPPPEIVEPEPGPPLRLTMDFTEDCWVEVVVDGARRLSELHVQGESLQIEAEERILLTLGNPAGVRVEVNGQPFPIDAAPGRVVRDVAIDLEALARLEQGAE